MSDQPAYEVIRKNRGENGPPELVICTYRGQTGAARVFSRGVQDACDRAFAQAREKAERGAA